MTRYGCRVGIPVDLSTGTLPTIVEKIRDRAFPSLVVDGGGFPVAIDVTFELDEETPDLWDLRGVVEEIRDEIEAYAGVSFEFPKPTPLAVTS